MKQKPAGNYHELSKALSKCTRARLEILHVLASGKRAPSRHVFFGWRSYKIEDNLNLIEITVSRKNRLPNEHLTENTSDT